MTVKEIVNQLCNMAVSHDSKAKMEHEIRAHFAANPKSDFKGKITLNDGEWNYRIIRWGATCDGYDYVLPDTREIEKDMIAYNDDYSRMIQDTLSMAN